jgi:hypothetical protein
MEILVGPESQRQDGAGRVVDRAEQREGRATGFEPGAGTAVDLDEGATRGFALAPAAVARGPARALGRPPEAQPNPPHRFPADLQPVDLAELFGQVHVVERGNRGPQLRRHAARRGLPPAAVAQRRRPAGLDAPLEVLELPNAQMQRGGAVAVGDAPGQRGFDQASPGQFLAAHRESLHEGMTLSRSSYPMTFSCSTGTGGSRA